MKKNVIFVLLTFVTLSLFAKTTTGDHVDPTIESKFKKTYGPLVNVSWKVIENISIATYTEHGEEKSVYYFDDGEVFGIGKMISRDQLPETVTESIKKRFSDGAIQTAYEFKTADSPTRYYVRVATPRHSLVVSGNEFGNLQVNEKVRVNSFR
jgi:hypothetical protein